MAAPRTAVVGVLLGALLTQVNSALSANPQTLYVLLQPIVQFYQVWKPLVDEFAGQLQPDAGTGVIMASRNFEAQLKKIDGYLASITNDGMTFPEPQFILTGDGCFTASESSALTPEIRWRQEHIATARSYLQRYRQDLNAVYSRLTKVITECGARTVSAVVGKACEAIFIKMEYDIEARIDVIDAKDRMLKNMQAPLDRHLNLVQECRPEEELKDLEEEAAKIRKERLRGTNSDANRQGLQQRLKAARQAEERSRQAGHAGDNLLRQPLSEGGISPSRPRARAPGCERAQIAAYDQWLREAEGIVHRNAQAGAGHLASDQQQLINTVRAHRNSLQAQCR